MAAARTAAGGAAALGTRIVTAFDKLRASAPTGAATAEAGGRVPEIDDDTVAAALAALGEVRDGRRPGSRSLAACDRRRRSRRRRAGAGAGAQARRGPRRFCLRSSSGGGGAPPAGLGARALERSKTFATLSPLRHRRPPTATRPPTPTRRRRSRRSRRRAGRRRAGRRRDRGRSPRAAAGGRDGGGRRRASSCSAAIVDWVIHFN